MCLVPSPFTLAGCSGVTVWHLLPNRLSETWVFPICPNVRVGQYAHAAVGNTSQGTWVSAQTSCGSSPVSSSGTVVPHTFGKVELVRSLNAAAFTGIDTAVDGSQLLPRTDRVRLPMLRGRDLWFRGPASFRQW